MLSQPRQVPLRRSRAAAPALTAVAVACPLARIVVYSSDASAARGARAAGAHQFVLKGVDLAELTAALRG